MNIVLFGFKNCGKGFVGKTLARLSKRPFVDTDNILEEIYTEEHGEKLSCREIAKRHGMDFFRKLEREAVKRATAEDKIVIAVGGSTTLLNENLELLRKKGKLVLLDVDKETLFSRIMSNGIPVFFDEKNPRKSFDKLFDERIPKFKETADFKIGCSDESTEQTAKKILQLIGKQ